MKALLGCREKGTLLHCWWECKLVQPLWKKIWMLFKKLNIDLPYDPAISLLRIYPKECDSGYSKGTCTPMFIAALFTISQVMETAKIHITEFYSAMKRMKCYHSQVNGRNWRTSF
jgi:hypothetical protein